jgi:hypothetical protein
MLQRCCAGHTPYACGGHGAHAGRITLALRDSTDTGVILAVGLVIVLGAELDKTANRRAGRRLGSRCSGRMVAR